MNRETLLALAERAEQASEADQYRLLIEAHRLIMPQPEDRFVEGGSTWAPDYSRWLHSFNRLEMMLNAKAYESAAMTLVPEGWFWSTGNEVCSTRGKAHLHKPRWDGERTILSHIQTTAATPALALVAASLRSIAEGNDNDD